MASAGDAEVALPAGRVRGRAGAVRCWRGLPYAQAPVGGLRWRAPQPVQPWSGVRDAVQPGQDPPQPPDPWLRAPMGEDCLHLTVWSPDGARGLPVLVWFFGGGFVGGSVADARTDGARLAAQGAVVVAVSYRVGLAGFLAHPGLSAESEHGSCGNYGLMDQLAALRWVQEHIAAFGGDPARVTGFGTSAGAASLSLLLTLPDVRGLLHGAILQSPGAFRRLASLEQAEQAGLAAGASIADLRALDWRALLARTGAVAGGDRSLTGPRVLRPIVDGTLLRHDEAQAERLGRFADLPLLLGSCFDEGRYFVERAPVPDVQALHARLRRDFGPHAARALQLYGARSAQEVPACLSAVFGDTQFTWGTDRLARLWAARAGAPAWRYLFARRRAGQGPLPTHVDEVPYVFGTLDDPAVGHGFDAQDRALSQALQQAWVHFAATGRPAPPHGADGLAWPQVGHGIALLDAPARTLQAWRPGFMRFLDEVFAAS